MASTRSSDELIEAALQLIARGGVDGLTLTQVAQHAGVSRATAYREFGDKEGLLSAVAQHEIGVMMTETLSNLDPHADPVTVIPAVVLAALRHLRGHAAFAYVREHEPHWLLQAGLVIGGARMDLVQTVAATVVPALSGIDDSNLLMPPMQAAEVLVRTVLSHSLIERSTLSDEQVAEVITRAVTGR